mmetsp:Transcript_16331/g.41411  ORF Transcript_16331/g.41411 Transcript_16331/m.41411 type:complete len:216 (-) Transcript_16331:37-684(-)
MLHRGFVLPLFFLLIHLRTTIVRCFLSSSYLTPSPTSTSTPIMTRGKRGVVDGTATTSISSSFSMRISEGWLRMEVDESLFLAYSRTLSHLTFLSLLFLLAISPFHSFLPFPFSSFPSCLVFVLLLVRYYLLCYFIRITLLLFLSSTVPSTTRHCQSSTVHTSLRSPSFFFFPICPILSPAIQLFPSRLSSALLTCSPSFPSFRSLHCLRSARER